MPSIRRDTQESDSTTGLAALVAPGGQADIPRDLGDKDIYRHERVGTALWSSVLDQMPRGRNVTLDGMNANYLGANLGDPKVHVDERLGTLLHSSSLDHFASGIKTPSELSVRSTASSKASTTKVLLAKVQELEANLAAERKGDHCPPKKYLRLEIRSAA